jgi:hypothetical protein
MISCFSVVEIGSPSADLFKSAVHLAKLPAVDRLTKGGAAVFADKRFFDEATSYTGALIMGAGRYTGCGAGGMAA